jgi:hypothetical protein
MLAYGMLLNIREVPLNKAMQEKNIDELKNVSILIRKSKFKLELYSDTVLVKSYRAVFGKNLKPEKMVKDDYITPIGDYKICNKDSLSKFHKFFKISYPNEVDITVAFRKKIIDKNAFLKLLNTFKSGDCEYIDSEITEEIGIHGVGKFNFIFKNLPFAFNWTNGSVAISDEAIDELDKIVNIGTKVTIVN